MRLYGAHAPQPAATPTANHSTFSIQGLRTIDGRAAIKSKPKRRASVKWKFLQFVPACVGVLVFVGCIGRWVHRDYMWIAAVAGLVSALVLSGIARRLSSLALIPLSFVGSYTLSVADYVYVLPNDFEGKITVVYHPKGPDRFVYSGFLKPTIRVEVPNSGLLVTSDTTALHRLYNDEEWRYRDGRVIKRFSWLAPDYSFVGSRGAESRGIRPDDPLHKWAVWDHDYYRLSTMNYEVLRGTGPIRDANGPNKSLEPTASRSHAK